MMLHVRQIFIYMTQIFSLQRTLDDSRPGNGLSCDGKDISNAIECLIMKRKIHKFKNLVSDVTSNGMNLFY